MTDWRTWKKGRKTTWHWNEFDGSGSREGIITEVNEDHAIMEADGMHLWIDDDTAVTVIYSYQNERGKEHGTLHLRDHLYTAGWTAG